jgi:hypothetical protein
MYVNICITTLIHYNKKIQRKQREQEKLEIEQIELGNGSELLAQLYKVIYCLLLKKLRLYI